jgi:hypothetical protein
MISKECRPVGHQTCLNNYLRVSDNNWHFWGSGKRSGVDMVDISLGLFSPADIHVQYKACRACPCADVNSPGRRD